MSIMSLPQMARRLPSGLSTLVRVAVLAAGIFLFGSSNPVTPAGYVGYLTRGAVFGRERNSSDCKRARRVPGAAGC